MVLPLLKNAGKKTNQHFAHDINRLSYFQNQIFFNTLFRTVEVKYIYREEVKKETRPVQRDLIDMYQIFFNPSVKITNIARYKNKTLEVNKFPIEAEECLISRPIYLYLSRDCRRVQQLRQRMQPLAFSAPLSRGFHN